jgi:hypothetical protein
VTGLDLLRERGYQVDEASLVRAVADLLPAGGASAAVLDPDAAARPPPPAGLPLSMEIARVDRRSCRRSQLTDGEGQCG